MVKIQIDLTEEEDRLVEIYKIANKLPSKGMAIRQMVNYFDVKITPKLIQKEEYYKKSLKSLGGK